MSTTNPMRQQAVRNNAASSSFLPFQKPERALKDFYGKYEKAFRKGRLTLFTPIYYPVALVELELLEQASEEFDTIEHTVLLLYKAGLRLPEQICDTMGLPLNYVGRILNILQGYGHIFDNAVTELGVKSAETGIKFRQYQIKHKVYGDTLASRLLPQEMIPPSSALVEPGQTLAAYPMVPPGYHLASEVLEQVRESHERYKSRGDESIFNVNVEEITDITNIEMRYTYGYLVHFDYMPHPFVLLQGRKGTAKEWRRYWKPAALSRDSLADWDYSGEATADEAAFDGLRLLAGDLTDELAQRMKKPAFMRRLKQLMSKHYGPGALWQFDGHSIQVEMDEDRLGAFSWELLQSIEAVGFCKHGLPHIVQMKDDLLLHFVCYMTASPALEELSQMIANLKSARPKLSLYSLIKGELSESEDQVSAPILRDLLRKLETEQLSPADSNADET